MATKKKAAKKGAEPKPTPKEAAPKEPTSREAAAVEAKKVRAVRTLGKLEKLARSTIKQVTTGANPQMAIPVRALSNVSFNEKNRLIELGDRAQSREFFNKSMAKKFMQTFLVAGAVKELLDSAKTTSIRDLFYMT